MRREPLLPMPAGSIHNPTNPLKGRVLPGFDDRRRPFASVPVYGIVKIGLTTVLASLSSIAWFTSAKA